MWLCQDMQWALSVLYPKLSAVVQRFVISMPLGRSHDQMLGHHFGLKFARGSHPSAETI
jgi:hypothetical protein